MEIKTPDSTPLHVRRWSPPSGQRTGSMVLVHGLGEHSGRYEHVAKMLAAIGLEVLAYDHRGFGQSGGKRGVIPYRDALLDDLKLVFETYAAESAAQPPVLLGHSMGGAIAARAVTGGWVKPRALVLSSPGLKSYLSPAMRVAVRSLSLVMPNFAVPHGLPLDKISNDEALRAASKSDPLNHTLISPRLTMFVVDAGEAAIRDAAKLNVPTLLQAAGDDRLVDPEGARQFAASAPANLCTLKIYDGLWHEIYNEREHDRAIVLADLKDWLLRVALR